MITYQALEALMVKAFVEQSVAPGLFWDALLRAKLYLPLPSPNQEPDPDKNEIAFLLGVDEEEKRVIWAFTSSVALVDYLEEEFPCQEIEALTFLKSVRNSQYEVVLIGPKALTLRLHPDLMASLSQGEVPELTEEYIYTVPKDTQVMGGPPKEEPFALQQKFSELFKETPEVLEASFIQISDSFGSRLLLGLRLQSESREQLKTIASLIAKSAEGILDKGEIMDITLINGSLKEAFKKWGKPFFKRLIS